MKFLAGLVVVAGCSSSASEPVDIAGVDLLVSPAGVVAYVTFVDGAPNNAKFAQPGACALGDTDAVSNESTCLDELSIDGAPITSTVAAYGGAANPYYGAAFAGDAMLHVGACGRGVDVPLHAGGNPAITELQAVPAGNDLVVSWSAPSAITAIVGVSGGYTLDTCHVTGTSHTFANAADALTVQVQAFRAPAITESELGQIRVWYGDTATLAL